jgi:hypothetical protein
MTDQPVETVEPTPVPVATPKKKSRWGCSIIVIILLILISTQITFFAVQPIGAIPNGVTLVMLRGQNTKLFDSADAMCERINNGVSLLCRGAVLAAVAENSTILMRLPYMPSIYLISTGGSTYGN